MNDTPSTALAALAAIAGSAYAAINDVPIIQDLLGEIGELPDALAAAIDAQPA